MHTQRPWFTHAMYLPLFPLSIVVYPDEQLNLHIFELRYRQLIAECVQEDRPFGIPTFLNDRLPGYGTEMTETDVAARYADGTLDIRTTGHRVFRIVDFENPAPGKLYAHGVVKYYPEPQEKPAVSEELLEAVAELYRILNQPVNYTPDPSTHFSYQVAHKVGLSLEAEYKLLSLETETMRQAYLLDHLHRLLPVAQNLERTKERIRMNGDFRKFGPLNL